MAQKKRPRSAQPTPNYTLRRVIVFGALIIILAALVWGLFSIIKIVTSSNTTGTDGGESGIGTQSGVEESQSNIGPQAAREKEHEDTEITPDGIVDADGRVAVPECSLAELKVSMNSVSTTVGNGVDIPYTVTNVGQTACQIPAGRFTFTVVSGNDTYLDTAMCTDRDPDERPLLLAAKSEWSSSFNWNGGIHNGCSAVDADGDGRTDSVEPGTYIANVAINGASSGAQAVVTVQ